MTKIRLKINEWPRLLILLLGLGLFLNANAQGQAVTGQVIGDGDALPGVSVLIKGTTSGTITDFDGKFSIDASSDKTLVISYVGYTTQEIAVGNQTTINTTLIADIAQLEEIVVIGYGTARKSDLTGALSQVSAESFEKQPLIRVEEALQGRAAGVIVSRATGQPGGEIKVRIRGVNSITGDNSPLVVIDGIIGGDLATLNPNDVASFDILKDASATAIYGSRGSNGVIMITTKRGSGKGKINVDFFTTISKVPDFLPQLGAQDFAELENVRRVRTGSSPVFSDAEIAALGANGGTDYQDEVFRTGVSKNLRISASGQEGKINYFISGDYVDQEGIIINTDYKRISLRTNVGAQVSDKVKISANVYGSRSENHNDFNRQNLFQGSPIFKTVTWDPSTPIFDDNGLYNFRSIKGIASLNDNPVFVLSESNFNDVIDRVNANLDFSYDILNNFNYRLIAGTSTLNRNVENYAVETGDLRLPNVGFKGTRTSTYQLSNILTWEKEFGANNLKITGVYEYFNSDEHVNGSDANGLTLPNGYFQGELAPNSGQSVNNNFTEREILSYMLRAEYSLANNLFVTATTRIDKSSVFRPGDRTGIFPSLAAAYSLNDMIEGSSVLSDLKFRAGWGQVGNQNIDPYSTFGTLKFNSYAFNGSAAASGTEVNTRENPNLQWEKTSQTNVGVDFGLLDGRANASIDVYSKNTTDLLLAVPIADVHGGGNITQNVGEVQNKGIDFSISYDVIDNSDLNWNTNFNVSYVKNEVTKLFGDVEEIEGTFSAPGGQSRRANVIQEGQPLGQFFGATFEGTWKSTDAEIPTNAIPGDAKYLLDESGEVLFQAIGNGTPTSFWGWNNTVTYKNWDLNVFVQGVHGFDVYNFVQAAITGGQGDSRSFLAAEQVNQWTPQNETDIPANSTFYNSSRFVEKGGFVRMSNVAIGYTFDKIPGLDETTLRIYFSGQNLFLITDYSGYDPEQTSRVADPNDKNNVDVAAGINSGAYPNPRTFTFGVKIGF